MNKAVFLDRDGTINEEMGYINHASRFKLFEFSLKAIKILNEAGFKVFIITNQSGLARGYFEQQLLDEIHESLLQQAQKENAKIEKIYYCPHHVDGVVEEFKRNCNCRKPKPGMLLQAQKEYNISLKDSYLISDRYKDIKLAHTMGLKPVLVMTGYGLGEFTYKKNPSNNKPDYCCENLLEAAQIISVNEHKTKNRV